MKVNTVFGSHMI